MTGSLEKKSFSNTRLLSSDPKEFCDRLKLPQQEKQAGNISENFKEIIVAKAEKVKEYIGISTKQHSGMFELLGGSGNIYYTIQSFAIYKCSK